MAREATLREELEALAEFPERYELEQIARIARRALWERDAALTQAREVTADLLDTVERFVSQARADGEHVNVYWSLERAAGAARAALAPALAGEEERKDG